MNSNDIKLGEVLFMRKGQIYSKITYKYDPLIHSEEKRIWQAISTIAVTNGGRIFVAYDTGWDGPDPRNPNRYITLRYSDDQGKTFSDELFYIDTVEDKQIIAGDPCLWLDPNDKLHLFWTQLDLRKIDDDPLDSELYGVEHRNLVNSGNWVYFEDSKGTTWEIVCEEPDAENPRFENPRYCFDQGMINKPLYTKSGRIIYSKYRYETVIPFEYSDDMGKTFKPVPHPCKKRYDNCEPCLFQRDDGTIVCIWRAFNFLNINYSYDNGETWTEIEQTNIQTPFTKPAVIKLPSGLVVMCHNDDKRKRQNLCLYTSKDDGKTWDKKILDKRYTVAYPDLDYRNGKLYLVYDHNRYTDKEICMMIFDEKDTLTNKIPEIITVCKPKGEITDWARNLEATYAQTDDINDY